MFSSVQYTYSTKFASDLTMSKRMDVSLSTSVTSGVTSVSKRGRRGPNMFHCLDFNVIHLLLTWLKVYEIVMLDSAICDSRFRSEFLLSLRLLQIGYNDMRCDGIMFPIGKWNIVKQFFSWSVLRELKFIELSITSSCEDWCDSIRTKPSCFRSLQELRIGIRHREGSSLFVNLARDLVHVPGLRKLEVSHSDIGAAEAGVLAESLFHVPGLQSLNISFNDKIGAEGALCVTECLIHVPGLQSLNICGNNIGAAGALSVAEGLIHVPGLQSLIISGNNIGNLLQL